MCHAAGRIIHPIDIHFPVLHREVRKIVFEDGRERRLRRLAGGVRRDERQEKCERAERITTVHDNNM